MLCCLSASLFLALDQQLDVGMKNKGVVPADARTIILFICSYQRAVFALGAVDRCGCPCPDLPVGVWLGGWVDGWMDAQSVGKVAFFF